MTYTACIRPSVQPFFHENEASEIFYEKSLVVKKLKGYSKKVQEIGETDMGYVTLIRGAKGGSLNSSFKKEQLLLIRFFNISQNTKTQKPLLLSFYS